MLQATGNTYSSKDDLKAVGFEFDSITKKWWCKKENFKKDDWEKKYLSASWNGRKNASRCLEIKIVEVK